MMNLPSGCHIWLVAGVTDMRKSFNGLGEQIQTILDENPHSGHIFIFRGRRGDIRQTLTTLWLPEKKPAPHFQLKAIPGTRKKELNP
ncbi:transposase [Salmonella enterica subsp. enterica serovar Newport]|nr:transposase [Salmonella enterica]ECI0980852.1 transposase [Salmonella enterica subsp. enterica serovar Newport]ECO0902130.1 transposase [Salmonella enterica subsp. enterica serovar Newport]